MKDFSANEPAPAGVYLSSWPPDLRMVGADGELLEGRDGGKYRRLPTLVVIALGPVLGGVFVLALPLLVIAAVLYGAVRLLRDKASASLPGGAALATHRWQPSASYLRPTDAAGEAGAAAHGEAEPETRDLQREVESRRDAER